MTGGDRVFVTGMAAFTRWGPGVARFLDRGHTETGPLPGSAAAVDPEETRFALFPPLTGEILDTIGTRRTGHRMTDYVLAALESDLGAVLSALEPGARERSGVVLGNDSGHLEAYRELYRLGTEEGHESVNPVHFPRALVNYAAVEVNDAYGLKGSSTTISSGVSAGLDAIGYAAMRLRLGRAAMLLAGGAHVLDPVRFDRARGHSVQSPESNGERKASGPAAEGVGLLLLTAGRSPWLRRDRILAEVLGYGGAKSRPHEEVSTRIEKATRCIRRAMAEAELTPERVDGIFGCTSRARETDGFEGRVLSGIFGERLVRIPVASIRSITGECFTASGALECLFAVDALRRGSRREEGLPSSHPSRACERALVVSLAADGSFAAVVLGGPAC